MDGPCHHKSIFFRNHSASGVKISLKQGYTDTYFSYRKEILHSCFSNVVRFNNYNVRSNVGLDVEIQTYVQMLYVNCFITI